KGIYPRPRGACMELLRAARVMMQRKIDPPAEPVTPGERILFAQAIHQRKEFRPSGWQTIYAALLQDEFPYVREVGLDCLPAPAEPALVRLVAKLLLDPNVDVQIAACRVTEKLKAAELREPLARVLNTAREEWLLGAASNAAYDWLPRLQYIRTFVARLDEEEMGRVCLSHLTSLLTGYSRR